MPAAERRRSRAVLFSEAALRQDPEMAVEELRDADVGVVVVGGGTVVAADSDTFVQSLEEPSNVDLSEVLQRLHNLQPGSFQIDVGNGLLFDGASGATLQLAISGIQLPSPDDEPPLPKRYRCTNASERHVSRLIGGVVGGPCPKELSSGGPCPGIIEAY